MVGSQRGTPSFASVGGSQSTCFKGGCGRGCVGALTTLAEPCTLTKGPIAAEHMGARVDGKLHSLGPKDFRNWGVGGPRPAPP